MAQAHKPSKHEAQPAYSQRFIEAVAFAAHEHRSQVRKGSRIPYMSHLMAVSGFVMEVGGTEDQWIAGLLHDAIEDAGVTTETLAERFGPTVASIVLACSDYDPAQHGDTKPGWRIRKETYIASLWHDPDNVLLVSCADKWHNSQAILNDLAGPVGTKVWTRFSAPPCCVRWYYRSILAVMEARLHNPYAVGRLRASVRALSREADRSASMPSVRKCAFGGGGHVVLQAP